MRVSFDGKQVQHRAVSVGQFADTSQQLGGLHTFHGRCFGSFDLPERIDLLTALQHVFLAQIPQGRIDENPSDPSFQRSLAPEIPDFGENGDKAVVQQILSDLAMAHIAETHAVHLRSVFFIQLLLRRPGHTEAAIDLARLAGLQPAGALIEIMNEDGTMARLPQLTEIARKFGLKIISIASLIEYRLREESIVEKGETVDLPTAWGDFRITPFRQKSNGLEHVALTKGEWTEDEPVLTRVHSSCATGDIFGSCRCDCGDQLHEAMRMIEQEGKGAIIYLQQEGRGIGLCNKIKAYKLQDEGLDTVDANVRLGFGVDERDYGVGASIIREMGIKHMRLMTNNPLKRAGLEGYGLKIDQIVPIVIAPNEHNLRYLKTKEQRMHHTLGLDKQ